MSDSINIVKFVINTLKKLLNALVIYYDFFLLQLVSQHGAEAERHLFRCLFSHIDFSGGDGKSNGKDQYQVRYFTSGTFHGNVNQGLEIVSGT